MQYISQGHLRKTRAINQSHEHNMIDRCLICNAQSTTEVILVSGRNQGRNQSFFFSIQVKSETPKKNYP